MPSARSSQSTQTPEPAQQRLELISLQLNLIRTFIFNADHFLRNRESSEHTRVLLEFVIATLIEKAGVLARQQLEELLNLEGDEDAEGDTDSEYNSSEGAEADDEQTLV